MPIGEESLRVHGEINFRIVDQTPDYVLGEMPVAAGILNPYGTIHAGALLWFADVIATVLALGKVEFEPGGQGFPLAINLHASFLGNQGDGVVRAEARFVRQGKRMSVVRTVVSGEGGRLLLDMTSTHIPA